MRHLLIHEPHGDSLMLLRRTLKSHNWQVDGAVSFRGALALAKSRRIDLVVANYVCDELDGLCLIESIRAIHPGVASVLISTAVPLLDLRRCREAGVSCILPKPLDLQALETTIDGLLQLKGMSPNSENSHHGHHAERDTTSPPSHH